MPRNSVFTFVEIMRGVLESEFVSTNLAKWIDLIFGYQQRGKEAEKAFNIYAPLCMDPGKVLQASEVKERNAYRKQAFHWGQTPQQIFIKKHVDRHIKYMDKVYNIFDPHAKVKVYSQTVNAGGAMSGLIGPGNLGASIAGNFSVSVLEADAKPAIKTIQEYMNCQKTIKIILKGDSGTDYFYHIGFTGKIFEGTVNEANEGDRKQTTGINSSLLAEMSSKKFLCILSIEYIIAKIIIILLFIMLNEILFKYRQEL